MTKDRKKRASGLITFIRGECANYDSYYDCCGCLPDVILPGDKLAILSDSDKCLVQRGRACSHFESVLLAVAKDKGLYGSIGSQYKTATKRRIEQPDVRVCDCGKELKPRRRKCDDCRLSSRRRTWREGRMKSYRNRRNEQGCVSTVKQNGILQVV